MDCRSAYRFASPPTGSDVNIFVYYESQSRLIQSFLPKATSWNVIELPPAFDVIDVVLVNQTTGSPTIFGIQITRSSAPFTGHHTFDTCTRKSKERLDSLWRVVCLHFNLDIRIVKKFYLMLAPNCKGADFRPPDGHFSDFYFSLSSVIPEDESSKMKKRRSQSKRKSVATHTNSSTRSTSKQKSNP